VSLPAPLQAETDVALKVDLHARPAGTLVKTALGFRAHVVVAFKGREANARSLVGILGLGATSGSTIRLRAEGDDASDALRAITSSLAAFQ
jgi:phosphotransferase system HPr (HPr) family protein